MYIARAACGSRAPTNAAMCAVMTVGFAKRTFLALNTLDCAIN
jgi:hypothetical protein